MDFKEYQEKADLTAIYPDKGTNLTYPTLGLCGETGEIAEKLKKLYRDKGGVIDDKWREETTKELGDVLWYLAALSRELGYDLEYVAQTNIDKLQSRKERGTIQGSGDNR